jgi:hypothetical protein
MPDPQGHQLAGDRNRLVYELGQLDALYERAGGDE